MTDEGARIDKWLYATRIFKTRQEATEACRRHHVRIDGVAVKPSRHVYAGETLVVNKKDIPYTYGVRGLIDKRVGAKVVDQYRQDLTPQDVLKKAASVARMPVLKRPRGSGRPTKKDRRKLAEARLFFPKD